MNAVLPRIIETGKDPLGLRIRADCGCGAVVHHAAYAEGVRNQRSWRICAGRAVCRLSPTRRWSISPSDLSVPLAGLAGISEVSGAIGQLRPTISPGYGFTAIIVAFLGRLNPLGIVAAGLILALTYLGGEAAQISIGITDKVTRLFQGLLLFFVLGCDTLIHYRIRLVFGSAQKGSAA
jgi:hypothetical protein